MWRLASNGSFVGGTGIKQSFIASERAGSTLDSQHGVSKSFVMVVASGMDTQMYARVGHPAGFGTIASGCSGAFLMMTGTDVNISYLG